MNRVKSDGRLLFILFFTVIASLVLVSNCQVADRESDALGVKSPQSLTAEDQLLDDSALKLGNYNEFTYGSPGEE